MLPEIDLIELALREDIGSGDVTVKYFADPHALARGRIFAKQPCVLAGTAAAIGVFRRVDATLQIKLLAEDGASLTVGQSVLELEGKASSLLTAERTALNFLQKLSGVASLTRRYVEAIAGTPARILDTRKTTPGWRLLEKAAVKAGGGTNHRFGLYDMAMVKDNHLAADGARLQESIQALRSENPDVRVELEADTLEQVEQFYRLRGVDVILLDNMTLSEMREAVRLRPRGFLLEASGGITLETIRSIAETGVDFISVGALTHSAPAVDLSLEIFLGGTKS